MPNVTAQGKTVVCETGANLRRVLLDHDVTLYNGNASLINCRGIGELAPPATSLSDAGAGGYYSD